MRTLELHAAMKQVQRSARRSSVAAAAYRSGQCLKDERTGIIYDFRRKGGVEHERIYSPDHAPQWAQDRTKLWNACELKENRKNSCTARELEVAFPYEFNIMQRREAGDKIARELMQRYGCAVDIAYHAPSIEGDERNYHAHIMFTTRSFDPKSKDGWARTKYRDLNNDKIKVAGEKTTRGTHEVKALRKFVALEMNHIAKRENMQIKTEYKSFKDRGIDKIPTKKVGAQLSQERRSLKTLRKRHTIGGGAGLISSIFSLFTGLSKSYRAERIKLKDSIARKSATLENPKLERALQIHRSGNDNAHRRRLDANAQAVIRDVKQMEVDASERERKSRLLQRLKEPIIDDLASLHERVMKTHKSLQQRSQDQVKSYNDAMSKPSSKGKDIGHGE